MSEHAKHSSDGKRRIPAGFIVGMVLVGACVAIALGAIAYGFATDSNPLNVLSQSTTSNHAGDDNGSSGARGPEMTEAIPSKGIPVPSDKLATAMNTVVAENRARADSSKVDDVSLLPTPLIAQYGDVLIHSPVTTNDIYALLFHQASYDYAVVMETRLPEIDANEVFETHQIDVPERQPTGNEYMNMGALHVWRTTEYTDMDTSVDVGAPAGSTVYAPVTGTVVLVKRYDLYDTIEDYEVHIQPTGHPELDGVCIHIRDVSVKAGDKVVGGSTPIAHVRDIAGEGIDEIHLAQFSDREQGNHAHFQINDVNYEGYRETKLEGALRVE